ncbi:hypothetical protein LCGC14_0993000 [marine sediment metagenome]|uniref:Uncharacterized protein n=1 Tax=marine sediment metagenome TaxID=412755 RepID=A0A0F9NRQ3_9ZZZZ
MTHPPAQFIVDEATGQQLTTVEYRCWMEGWAAAEAEHAKTYQGTIAEHHRGMGRKEGWAAAMEWMMGPCPHQRFHPTKPHRQRRQCGTCCAELRQGVKP